jgi:hypothetical protein
MCRGPNLARTTSSTSGVRTANAAVRNRQACTVARWQADAGLLRSDAVGPGVRAKTAIRSARALANPPSAAARPPPNTCLPRTCGLRDPARRITGPTLWNASFISRSGVLVKRCSAKSWRHGVILRAALPRRRSQARVPGRYQSRSSIWNHVRSRSAVARREDLLRWRVVKLHAEVDARTLAVVHR